GDRLKRLIGRLDMHLIEDIDAYSSLLNQRAHSVWKTELHDSTIGNDQGMLHSETFEIVCHLVCGTRPKLYWGHLHREDGFVGDIKATHTVLSQLYLPGVSLQERQRGLVKLVYLLIDGCVGTPLENHQLRLLNGLLERIGKTG